MRKVVVIGRNYTSRLGMIRAVGMIGYDVYVINTRGALKGKEVDAYSKYVKEYLFAKEPDRKELLSVIMSLKSENVKSIIIPVDDFAASTIDKHLDLLKNYFLFPNVNMEQGAINRLMDKHLQKFLARKSGLNVVDGWTVEIKNHVYNLPKDIIYPVFPKPQISFKGNKGCMVKCNNETELRRVLNEIASKRDCPMLLEKYAIIEKEYALLGFSDGRNVEIPGVIQMLESGKGGHCGVTLFGTVFPIEDRFPLNQLKQFIRSLHFVGLFDIDAFESNGVFYFNELNLRFGASGYALTKLDINLPQCLINNLLGQETCMCGKVQGNVFFANEKVAYDDWFNLFISRKDYDGFINKADFSFIKSDLDCMPYKEFVARRFSCKNRLRRFAKFVLYKSGLQ